MPSVCFHPADVYVHASDQVLCRVFTDFYNYGFVMYVVNIGHQVRACGYSQGLVLCDQDLSKACWPGVDTPVRYGVLGDRFLLRCRLTVMSLSDDPMKFLLGPSGSCLFY